MRDCRGFLISNTLLGCGAKGTIKGVGVVVAKEDSPKFTEKGSLQRLRKKISKHIFRGTMDDVDALAF